MGNADAPSRNLIVNSRYRTLLTEIRPLSHESDWLLDGGGPKGRVGAAICVLVLYEKQNRCYTLFREQIFRMGPPTKKPCVWYMAWKDANASQNFLFQTLVTL